MISRVQVISVFLFCVFSWAFVAVQGQEKLTDKKITIRAENKSIIEVLKQIEQISTVHVVYTSSLIPKNYKVNINVKEHAVAKVLTSVLKNTGLGWKELDGHIVIYKDPDNVVKKQTKSHRSQTNIINVINVYDTIVERRYETVTNIVYDTLQVLHHDTLFYRDTIIHEAYKDKVVRKRIAAGVAYERATYLDNKESVTEYYSDYYFKSEKVKSLQTFQASFSYERNRLRLESGIGLTSYELSSEYRYPDYTPLFKDTTVFIEEEYTDYRMEGDEIILYTNYLWYDTTYSILYDSTLNEHKQVQTGKALYASIPLSIGYCFYQKERFSLYANAGGIAHFYLTSEQEVPNNLFKLTEYSGLFFSYFAGLSVEYYILSKVLFQASANYTGQINSRHINAYNSNNLSSINVKVGISYILKQNH